jgi:GTPase
MEFVCLCVLLQEIPYVIEHRLMDWKELKDGFLRVEHHFISPKRSQH